MTESILRLPEVMQKTGLSRSSIYAMMAKGTFPQSVSLGERAIGWLQSDIDNWIVDRTKIIKKPTIVSYGE